MGSVLSKHLGGQNHRQVPWSRAADLGDLGRPVSVVWVSDRDQSFVVHFPIECLAVYLNRSRLHGTFPVDIGADIVSLKG